MSHHTASLQFTLGKTATAFDLARTAANRLYWLDDTYVQPFYSWAAPRLRKVAISGLFWALVTLIDITLWLIDTTSQFMARDAHAIAIYTFAQAHDPLPEFPALPPAAVPLALPSMLLPMTPTPEALDDIVPALALRPSVMPLEFSLFLNPDRSVRSWLTTALPPVLAGFIAETVPVPPAVVPVATEDPKAAPVVNKSPKAKATDTEDTNKEPEKATDKTKTSRNRSRRTATTAAQ